MDIRQFRSFVTVAEMLHFSRAAEALGIAPPSMTKQIQEIERELGVRLFQRTKRTVQLTAAGAIFLEEARRVVEQAAKAEEAARRAGRGELGRIEIGYVASTAYSGVLQKQMATFRSASPGVEINCREVAMDRLPEMLDEGRIDIAFLRPPMTYPPGIRSVTLLRDPFVAAIHESHALASKRCIEPSELSEETFIIPEQEAGTLEVARRGGFEPRRGPRPGSLVAVMAQVSLGAGVSVVPNSILRAVNLPGVTFREIAPPLILSEIAAAFRLSEAAPATLAFIARLRTCALTALPSDN